MKIKILYALVGLFFVCGAHAADMTIIIRQRVRIVITRVIMHRIILFTNIQQ